MAQREAMDQILRAGVVPDLGKNYLHKTNITVG